jgi:hypothetical protein
VTIETFRRVRILNNVDKEVVNIENTTLVAGGYGRGGDIILHPPSSTNVNDSKLGTIYLEAANERMTIVKDSTRKATIVLDGGEANLWMGGNNTDGDIVLFPGTATDINDLNQATIHLDGSTGDILLRNADCAEDFDVTTDAEPGTVMVLNEVGKLRPSQVAYDRKVTGVISGADGYKPAIILDRKQYDKSRVPIALMGKVYCKVDTKNSPIEAGDLLTTSDTPGHAMKADDPVKAFGAVIGKALKSLGQGRGLIPILIALQ